MTDSRRVDVGRSERRRIRRAGGRLAAEHIAEGRERAEQKGWPEPTDAEEQRIRERYRRGLR